VCKSSRILTETAISGRSRPYHRERRDRRWRIAPAAPPGRLTAPTSPCKQGQGNMSKNNHRQPPFHSLGRPAPLSRTELHVVSRSEDANRIIDSDPPTEPEPFVTAKEAGRFLCLSVRRVLEMARLGQLPAHPIGPGKRHTWRFRLSELAHAVITDQSLAKSATISAGSPSGPGQEK